MNKFFSSAVIAVMSILGLAANAQEKGVLYFNGNFYPISSLADSETSRPITEDPISPDYGVNDKYIEFNFDASKASSVLVKAQGPSTKEGHVYLNGEEVARNESHVEDIETVALELKNNDVVKIYDHKPFVVPYEFGFMQPRSEVWDKVKVTYDRVKEITDLNLRDVQYNMLEGTEIRIEATEGNKIAHVYYGMTEITPVDGVFTFRADMQATSMLVNIDVATPNSLTVLFDGTFNALSAYSQENNRNSVFSTGGPKTHEYNYYSYDAAWNPIEFKLNPGGVGNVVVYLNNVKEENTEEGKDWGFFYKVLNLKGADVMKVYDVEPYWSNVTLGFMQPRAQVYDKVEVLMDGITPLDMSHDLTYKVLQNTVFKISAKEGEKILSVTVNNNEIAPEEDGSYLVYANQEGDILVNIDMKFHDERDAMAFYTGDFYTFAAQADKDHSVEPFDIKYGTYENVYRPFSFDDAYNPYHLVGQNADKNIRVFINNEEVPNSETGIDAGTFDAYVNFNEGDVVKVFGCEPYWTNMEISFMQPRAEVYNKVVVTMDRCKVVEGLDQAESIYKVLQGTQFEIRAVEGEKIGTVYVNNVEIEPVGGSYFVTASQAGDMLVIIDMGNKVDAKAYVAGDFRNFSITDVMDPRHHVLDLPLGYYEGEYRDLRVEETTTYRFVGSNEAKDIHVFVNNTEIPNSEVGEDAGTYDKDISLAANDVIKIFGFKPEWQKVEFGSMQPRAEVFNKVVVTMDEITVVKGLDKIEGAAFNVLPGTVFEVRATEGNAISKVIVDNEEIEGVAGVYTFTLTQPDNLVIINTLEPKEGVIMVNGSYDMFYGASTQYPRVQPIAFEQGTYTNEYRHFVFDEFDNPFRLTGHNTDFSFFVYLNDEVVENSESGKETQNFDAIVTFNEGDVLKVYDAQPKVANVEFSFMTPYAETCNKVEVVKDVIIPVDLEETPVVKALEGTQFTIKAAEGEKIGKVYVCNEEIEPVNGVYTFNADREGDMLVIIELVSKNTVVTFVDAKLRSFMVCNPDNNRPVWEVSQGEYFGEYGSFDFTTDVNPYRLVGSNENNDIHVFLNDEEIENSQVGIDAKTFDQLVTLSDGDVLKIVDGTPEWLKMQFGFMQPRADYYDKVVVVFDEVNRVTTLDQDCEYTVLSGTKVSAKAVEGYTLKSVTVCNEDVTPDENGVYTFTVTNPGTLCNFDFQQGTGIDGIEGDDNTVVNVYNLQGMLVKKNITKAQAKTLSSGLYIINNTKVVIR